MEFYNKYFEVQKVKADINAPPLRIHWWAIGIITIGVLAYFLNFAVRPFIECKVSGVSECGWQWISSTAGTWGEFGDFIGGTINPFIGFLTVILLVHSIKLTTDALKQNETALNVSKDELIETRRAVEQATAAQKKMEESLNDQLAEAKSQNNLSNYFIHRTEYIKYLEEVKLAGGSHLVSVEGRYLHGLIYPNVKVGDRKKNIDIYTHLCRNVSDLLISVGAIEHNSDLDRNKLMNSILDESETLRASFENFLNFHLIDSELRTMTSGLGSFTGKVYSPVRSAFLGYVTELKCFQICFAFDADTMDYKLRWIIGWLEKCASAYPYYSVEEESTEKNQESFKRFLEARDSQFNSAKNMLRLLKTEMFYLQESQNGIA